MKKNSLAAGAAILAVAGMFSAFSKTTTAPAFTSLWPLAVGQGQSATVAITGGGFAKNTSLLVNGTSYPLKVNSSTSAEFTFTPDMTQKIGFYAVQVKTANKTSQAINFQVCAPLVFDKTSLNWTQGVPLGDQDQLKIIGGGCVYQ
jgi:hypothetical protein